ncbi:MAG: KpsF/GutQ family sugar-phosphate isomerase [Hyphomicrobium sp.]|nr:KpsF/GutQ family sugar-phosphate isomerase [Hyphomicrobium sp.]
MTKKKSGSGRKAVALQAEAKPKSKKSARKTSALALTSAVRTLTLESDGLAQLAAGLEGALAEPFADAVDRLRNVSGRVIVTGIGKSGHVGQKIAATFASTGTPAFFVHPTEASHGDLGMVTRNDLILALSWSGETVELKPIITYSRRFAVPLVAVTSRADSALGQNSDVVLLLPRAKEACPHGLAPTTSTTMQLALGDSLAIALLEARGFTAHDFKIFHPGGSLGANLKYVADVMHKGDRLPLAPTGLPMAEALVTMTEKSLGCLGIVDRKGNLSGVITDGDLRRHMGAGLLKAKVDDIMTAKPKTIQPTMLASAALELINASRITALFVVDKGRPVGIIHVHDLLRLGVA